MTETLALGLSAYVVLRYGPLSQCIPWMSFPLIASEAQGRLVRLHSTA